MALFVFCLFPLSTIAENENGDIKVSKVNRQFSDFWALLNWQGIAPKYIHNPNLKNDGWIRDALGFGERESGSLEGGAKAKEVKRDVRNWEYA